MNEILVAIATFLCLTCAGGGIMAMPRNPSSKHLEDGTVATVRRIANLFIVLACVVLGLLMSSAKSNFEAMDHGIHDYATELIRLDRTVQSLGPEGDETHRKLIIYMQWLLSERSTVDADRESERLLDEVGDSLRAIHVPDDQQLTSIWNDARRLYVETARRRWDIVEQSEGTIPVPLLVLAITWLALIFASYGYRAQRNVATVTTLVAAALLMAGSIYLMLAMDAPSSSMAQALDHSFRQARAEIQH